MGWEELEKMSPKVRAKYQETLSAIPPEKRLRRPFELTAFVMDIMAAGIRKDNPGISDEEVRWEVICRRLSPELRRIVYGR